MFSGMQSPLRTHTAFGRATGRLRLPLTLTVAAFMAACSAGGSSGIGSQNPAIQAAAAAADQGGASGMLTTSDNTIAASAESLSNTGHLVLKGNVNKCLGVGPDGISVGLFDCAGMSTQGWTVKGQSLVHSSGKCLAVNGASANGSLLTLATCSSGQAAQLWTVGAQAITQGSAGKFCLDVKDHIQAEGNPVQIWSCTSQANQTWRVAPLKSQAAAVVAMVTAPDLSLALSSVTVDTGSTAQSDAADATVVLDPGVTYQTITGFGASLTDSSSFLMHTGLTQPVLDAAMERLFDPAKGIGISLLRQPMGASDFSSVGNFSYNDTAFDTNMASFSIAQDLKHTVPLLKTAVSANPALFVMGTPWSPPAWMKNNNSMYGSPSSGGSNTLKGNMGQAYAQYFVKFVQAYAQQGIKISAVTPQNEPLNDGTLPSLSLSANQAADFVGNNLGPALKAAQLQTKVWAYDHNWDRPDYPQTLLDNSTSRPFVGAAAFHCYGGNPQAMTDFHNQNPDMQIQMTECSDGAWHTDSFADMSHLIIDSTNNWSSSVVFWALALDPTGGPMNQGCNNCTALVTVDPTNHSIAYNIDFYIMGQVSKFVVPGAKRIKNTLSGDNLSVATFANADGSEVALVYNTSGNSQAITVKGSNNTVNLHVAAHALATVKMMPQGN